MYTVVIEESIEKDLKGIPKMDIINVFKISHRKDAY